ncbi:MAG: hypothetical protein J7K34_05635 [Flavobacteriaceae bacterium]|nr:hypothetical protein [Flavobacteriaceae bacterium]
MNFISQQNEIKKQLGLGKCQLIWSEKNVKTMLQGNDVNEFFVAFKKAIHSFLTDGSNIDSFYAMIKDMPENYGLSNSPDGSSIQSVIQENMNSAKTKITLVTPKTQFQPEEGESPLENWIFLVEETQMSPGLNWAIINKQSGKVYNYGIT